ncbi:hypothetical protein CAOG_000755 [Capsaspora owczarzaki ATCC 30864]|uniref:CG-1 domain-containing protein n=2 Tax=Capsaspora owczarzaki (strain ATCC 30864) TaxID=595528 RepID=A0A0D2WJ45_CAPO3|nr:hypothetical protein CAOG_000755 [Capsaspora owczarzaki ATCC 30864]
MATGPPPGAAAAGSPASFLASRGAIPIPLAPMPPPPPAAAAAAAAGPAAATNERDSTQQHDDAIPASLRAALRLNLVLSNHVAWKLTPEHAAVYLLTYARMMHHASVGPSGSAVLEVPFPVHGTTMILNRGLDSQFRKDEYAWQLRKGSKHVRENHMTIKIDGREFVKVSYARLESNPYFYRRVFWLVSMPKLVLVHYVDDRLAASTQPPLELQQALQHDSTSTGRSHPPRQQQQQQQQQQHGPHQHTSSATTTPLMGSTVPIAPWPSTLPFGSPSGVSTAAASPAALAFSASTLRIADFSPEWAVCGESTKFLIVAPWIVASIRRWSCRLGSAEYPAEMLYPGILRVYIPAITNPGILPLSVVLEGGLASPPVFVPFRPSSGSVNGVGAIATSTTATSPNTSILEATIPGESFVAGQTPPFVNNLTNTQPIFVDERATRLKIIRRLDLLASELSQRANQAHAETANRSLGGTLPLAPIVSTDLETMLECPLPRFEERLLATMARLFAIDQVYQAASLAERESNSLMAGLASVRNAELRDDDDASAHGGDDDSDDGDGMDDEEEADAAAAAASLQLQQDGSSESASNFLFSSFGVLEEGLQPLLDTHGPGPAFEGSALATATTAHSHASDARAASDTLLETPRSLSHATSNTSISESSVPRTRHDSFVEGSSVNNTSLTYDDAGMTLLHYLAALGTSEIVNVVLYWKSAIRDRATIESLLWRSLDVMSTDARMRTPLFWACALGHTTTVRALLEYDSRQLRVSDAWGKLPIDVAFEHGRQDVVDVLNEYTRRVDNGQSQFPAEVFRDRPENLLADRVWADLQASQSEQILERDFRDMTLKDRDCLDLFRAATIIQTAFRDYQNHQREQRMAQAAMLIQNAFRRHKHHSQFRNTVNAAVRIQNVYRAYRQHSQFKQTRSAALTIQRQFRERTERRRMRAAASQDVARQMVHAAHRSAALDGVMAISNDPFHTFGYDLGNSVTTLPQAALSDENMSNPFGLMLGSPASFSTHAQQPLTRRRSSLRGADFGIPDFASPGVLASAQHSISNGSHLSTPAFHATPSAAPAGFPFSLSPPQAKSQQASGASPSFLQSTTSPALQQQHYADGAHGLYSSSQPEPGATAAGADFLVASPAAPLANTANANDSNASSSLMGLLYDLDSIVDEQHPFHGL